MLIQVGVAWWFEVRGPATVLGYLAFESERRTPVVNHDRTTSPCDVGVNMN